MILRIWIKEKAGSLLYYHSKNIIFLCVNLIICLFHTFYISNTIVGLPLPKAQILPQNNFLPPAAYALLLEAISKRSASIILFFQVLGLSPLKESEIITDTCEILTVFLYCKVKEYLFSVLPNCKSLFYKTLPEIAFS